MTQKKFGSNAVLLNRYLGWFEGVLVTQHQPLAASINVYFDGKLWIKDITFDVAGHSPKYNIYYLLMVEQVHCLRGVMEELYMEQTSNTNFALNFEGMK